MAAAKIRARSVGEYVVRFFYSNVKVERPGVVVESDKTLSVSVAIPLARAQTQTFRITERVKQDFLDQTLLEAFAVAREASWRVLGQKHYKVQVMGAIGISFANYGDPS